MSLSDTASFSRAAASGSPISSGSVVSPCCGGLYSIRAHFNPSCSVLLTGATGYIGSLMLEKLLRSTTVGRVYVLVRPRRGYCPADRLARLMSGPLFHLIGEEHAARVTAVAGDILAPGLGLSLEDEQLLLKNVDTVIHSAAGAVGEWRVHARGTHAHVGNTAASGGLFWDTHTCNQTPSL